MIPAMLSKVSVSKVGKLRSKLATPTADTKVSNGKPSMAGYLRWRNQWEGYQKYLSYLRATQ